MQLFAPDTDHFSEIPLALRICFAENVAEDGFQQTAPAMTQLQSPPALEEILAKYDSCAKRHTLREMQVREDLNGATVLEIEIWRPVGTFQIILDEAEVERYGECGALDRHFQTREI
jgi:hypothetical protein